MHSPTFAEIAALLLLIAVSTALFAQALMPVVRTIRASRPDSGFVWGSTAARVRNWMDEVLLQRKVMRERPLPGLAHAMVFWGFLVFGLVTADHILSGFGLDLLQPDGMFGRVYFAVVGVFALAVTGSMLALAVRRFVVRPRWLGELSGTSAVITVLILTLMLTYLAGWLWLPEDSFGGRANWWLHTIALFVFLPIVPRSKHLHLLMSPIAIFLRRGKFSFIPPLTGDEDFGIETGKDVSSLVALQVFSCVECGRCTEHCPANNTGKLLDPKEIALGVRRYLRGHGPNATEPIVGTYIPEKMLWQCTSCGACEYQCPVGIEHLPIIVGLRRGLVNTGKWEDAHGEKLFLNLEKYGNSLGFPQSERDKFIAREQMPVFDGRQEYCLWLGCMGAYDPAGRDTISSLVRVLTFLGVTWGVLKKEKCTGDPARRLGNDLLVSMLAEFNAEQLKAGERRVRLLTICPHCVRTMAEDWREFGIEVEIEHHSEFLARHASRMPSSDTDGSTVFHDPCYLGRYAGKYDQPRVTAQPDTEPVRARQRGFCCGAGGGRMFLGEEEGKRVNVERAEQLADTGASTVAAACPFCNSMLRDGLGKLEGKAPQLVDIAQIAAARLPR